MIADEFDGVWFCQECDKTFVFRNDVIYHTGKTGHKAQRDE